MQDHTPYRPTSPRRRLLIVLLAIGTAVTIILTLLAPPAGSEHRHDVSTPDVLRCRAGNTSQCVGGKADVIVVPALHAASAPKP